MNDVKHLSWENFSGSLLVPGDQRVHRVYSSPGIELFWDGSINRVGIWIEAPGRESLSDASQRLASVSITNIDRQGRNFLQLACESRAIFRQFYSFAIAVADRVIFEGLTPSAAVDFELQCFGDLLREKPLLGLERQVGLLGELLILERLLKHDGPNAIRAWVGPTGEPHDFRIGESEFEVKTTTNSRRIHMINGLSQLLPSPNCSLYVLSILLGPAGSKNGFSLAEKVNYISSKLIRTPVVADQFNCALEANGYFQPDAKQYRRSFNFRRPLALIAVNEQVPAITMDHLKALLGSESSRIEHIAYDLNFEGLQSEEPTEAFVRAFPYPAT